MKTKIKIVAAVGLIFLVNFYYRSFTFTYSTIDWDELTYFIMGKSIVKGFLPYRDYWDLKPLGIYLIHAFTLLFFDYSVLTMRISAYIFSSMLAVILFVSNYTERFRESLLVSLGFLYSLIYYSSGLASNTEIYFLFFEAISFYLLFVYKEVNVRQRMIAFFTLGVSFVIKYIIVFDVILFFIAAFLFSLSDEKAKKASLGKDIFGKIFFEYLLHVIVFLIPFLVTIAVYIYFDSFDSYWNSILAVGKNHVRVSTIYEKFEFIFYLKYFYLFSFLFLAYQFYTTKRIKLDRKSAVSFGWFLSSSVGAVWTGFLYEHYLIAVVFPIMLFISFVAFDSKNVFGQSKKNQMILLLCIVVVFMFSIRKRNHLAKTLISIPDEGLLMANAVRKITRDSLSGPGYFFVASGSHAPYVILDQLPPVNYIQPNDYLEQAFAVNFSISGNKIVSNIIEKKVNIVTWCNSKSIHEILNQGNAESEYSLEFVLALQTYLRDYRFESIQIKGAPRCTLYYKRT
ncbi:ArnT family glycosyltransferase [Leptospira meyeri]|uniref:ArnT family glycosyltransferase n=1 Tax=Leptospira meyeri TaxID=29508 RepID=UPI0010838078|nr:hypothetical protein [Leptospira meyeri]TGL10724.1 hypothetical protein EHQ50_17480 [Leptospira meyeri]